MFADGLTVHLSLPEAILIAIVLALAVLREVLHPIRSNAEELLRFRRWWAFFRADWTSAKAVPDRADQLEHVAQSLRGARTGT